MFLGLSFPVRLVLSALVSLILCLAVTPAVKAFACRAGAMDCPDSSRRVHDHPIPRLGGLAILIGFLLSVLLFCPVSREVQGILLGCILVSVTGAVDDFVSLSPWVKLAMQLLAAVIAMLHGVRIPAVSPLDGPGVIHFGGFSLPLTLIWIVGVTNAMNLVDGLDGLAAGLGTIAGTATLAVSLLVNPSSECALLLAALAGACLGFLPYNHPPARIFMGDTGSLLLGFVLSTVSVLGPFRRSSLVSLAVPVLVLAVPLADTVFAIVRRLLRGQNPMKPDRGHFHHLLLDRGLSQQRAVMVLYSINLIFALLAVLLALVFRSFL